MSIKIGTIAKDAVNTMLSETLCLPPSICNPLSSIIHNRTGGIILFIMNFLISLNEEGLLWFNLSTRRWDYDIAGIQEKEVSADVVQHMSQRMKRLPKMIQYGLKLCSCLGASFDVNTLRKGGPKNDFDVEEFLPFSVEVSSCCFCLILAIKKERTNFFCLSRVVFYVRTDNVDTVGLMIRCSRRHMP